MWVVGGWDCLVPPLVFIPSTWKKTNSSNPACCVSFRASFETTAPKKHADDALTVDAARCDVNSWIKAKAAAPPQFNLIGSIRIRLFE